MYDLVSLNKKLLERVPKPSTNEGAKVKKFLTDFIYYLRIFRHMPVKNRVRTAWRNAGMTL